MLKTLQNFYRATTSRAWAIGTGNRYVSTLPTPTAGRLVINPSNTTKREIISYDGIGTDGNGNYVTVTERGIGETDEQTHSINEPVRMNFTAEYYADVQTEVDNLQDEIDTLVLQNAPNASDTVKGIAKLSVAAVESGTPVVVGDNDPRVPASDPDALYAEKPGVIKMYGGASAPTGYLNCDGDAVSRETYAGLFGVLGETYGVGDGSTTFNVPDLKGRFPLGYSDSAPTKVLNFSSRSSNTITVTGISNTNNNEIQTGRAVLYEAPSGAMTGLTHNTTYYLIRVAYNQFSLATSVANSNSLSAITLSSDGTGTQTFTMTFSARALGVQGGEETHALTVGEMPSHNHPKDSNTMGTSSKQGESYALAGRTGSSEVYTLSRDALSFPTAQSQGSNLPHNNLPPYTVVNFIIKT